MRVVITGGAGFIGRRLAEALLERGYLAGPAGDRDRITELVIFDVVAPSPALTDPRVRVVVGDMTRRESLAEALGPDPDTIFHFAGVVSGAAEADLALGLAVNLDGTRLLLDLAAATGRRPKIVFASTGAVYGGPDALHVTDRTTPTPLSSYGVQKLCSELLIGDYDRRGLIDGRAMRFPTIAVRPGKPNRANSSFISSVIREPAAGVATVCPVPDDVPIALMSPGRLIAAILKVHDMPSAEFGWPRTLVLPAVQVNVRQMLDALVELRGEGIRKLVSFEPDERIVPMVKSWPASVTSERAARLGIETDSGAMEIVSDYLQTYVG